jgi:biopolymer transport protein ExbB
MSFRMPLIRLVLTGALAALAASISPTSVAQTAAPPAPASAPAAAAPAAPAAPVAPTGVTAATPAAAADNPYGLEAVWKGSDAVTKAVLLILVVMSMGSWYIIIVKLIEQSKINRQAKLAAKSFWTSGTVRQGADTLEAQSPFRFIAEAGLEATKKHDGLLEHVDLNSWVTMSIQRSMERVQSRLQDGLAFLATVGSTAPFVGLFGTVWGIYHALTAIGIAGQASIDKVAGPVGEALIMTAIGLAVAVPAVLGYNWLVRRNKGSMDEVRAFGNDLYAVLLSTTASAKR